MEEGSWRKTSESKESTSSSLEKAYARFDEDVEAKSMDRLSHTDVEHIILIPNYKEDLEVLRETLDCLASHPVARTQYRVCLAMEAREIEASSKAGHLLNTYNDSFKAITATMHPADVPGEAVGKASNVNYAARQIAGASSWSLRARQLITTLDADIFIAADFFEMAARKFVAASREDRARMMFLLPIVFDRNAASVPPAVRATDVTWALAGMSTMYPSSMIKIPTSTYAVSMEMAIRIGFWDVGHEGIGEDFHMCCKALLSSDGLISEVIYSPASVTDVIGKHHGVPWWGYLSDMQARYLQAVRHLWGSLDTGYVLRRLIAGGEDKCATAGGGHVKLASRSSSSGSGLITAFRRSPSPTGSVPDTPSDSSTVYPGRESGETTPVMEATIPPLSLPSSFEKYQQYSLDRDELVSDDQRRPGRSTIRILALLCKCYQAHLMLVHFAIFLAMPQLDWRKAASQDPMCAALSLAAASSSSSTLAFSALQQDPDQMDPLLGGTLTNLWAMFREMSVQVGCRGDAIAFWTLFACASIRFLSVFFMISSFLCYHFYRKEAVQRWSRPGAQARIGTRPGGTVYDPTILSFVDYAFFPLGVLYSVVPALYAHAMQMFTNELRYTVSFKPKVAGKK